MFALTSLYSEQFRVNLKCNPERAIDLRESYPNNIFPGFHMNKKHWNTVLINASIPKELIVELINHSYELAIKSLPKKIRVAQGL